MELKEYKFVGDLKAAKDDEGVFEGYASTFGNIDSTGDIIQDGAFAESLKQREPKVLWQHDMHKPVGKLIDAREDKKGLWVKVKLALGTTLGKDAYEYMKEGIIDKLSIGFRVNEAEYDAGTGLRTIKEVELFEFSLVTIPANDEAGITRVKSEPQTEREFERALCGLGYSRTVAKAIVAEGFKGYQNVLRDADVDIPNDALRDADEVVKTLSSILEHMKGNQTCPKN